MLRKAFKQYFSKKMQLSVAVRFMATDSEIKSAAGISNVEHSHYSKKEF